jgi:MSHA pilin protein MshD
MSINPVRQEGLSLIELIIALVVFAIALTATLAAVATITVRSADPMIQTQALYIAQGYMDEILSRPAPADKPCANPDDPRDEWQQVACYDGLNESPQDPLGHSLDRLQAYQVEVSTDDSASLNGVSVTRITVTVRYGQSVNLELVAYQGDL